MTTMCFGEKLKEYVNAINVFLDINLTLYTVTGTHHMAGFSLIVIIVFHSLNLALFTVTRIHSIVKRARNNK